MIIKSKILINVFSLNFARAMALYPFILIKHEELRNDKFIINHEKIHLRQQVEMLIIFFYLWYLMEFLIKFIKYKNRRKAYENISFEKEAYDNECNLNYLTERKFYSFLKYL